MLRNSKNVDPQNLTNSTESQENKQTSPRKKLARRHSFQFHTKKQPASTESNHFATFVSTIETMKASDEGNCIKMEKLTRNKYFWAALKAVGQKAHFIESLNFFENALLFIEQKKLSQEDYANLWQNSIIKNLDSINLDSNAVRNLRSINSSLFNEALTISTAKKHLETAIEENISLFMINKLSTDKFDKHADLIDRVCTDLSKRDEKRKANTL